MDDSDSTIDELPSTSTSVTTRSRSKRSAAERQRDSRASKSQEVQEQRRGTNREAKRNRRSEENEEEHEERIVKQRGRTTRNRDKENDDERSSRRKTDASRQKAQRRSQARQVVIPMPVAEPNYLGKMNKVCSNCQARFFAGEVKKGKKLDEFNLCCNFGLIEIEDKFSDYPDELRSLLTSDSTKSKNFLKNIRQFNSALAMASMGAQLDIPRGHGPYCFRIHGQVYHLAGPLHPDPGKRPAYGQIYILDTAQAANERLGTPANKNCDRQVMIELSTLLAKINRYAQSYKMMAEVEDQEERDAALEGRDAEPIRMIFDESTTRDPRRYNVPQANEVAVVYVGEDGDVPATRSLAIHPRGGGLQQIRDISPLCDPFTYPVLFPTGKYGWHPGLKKKPSDRKLDRITQMDYYCYLLMVREGVFNPLHHAGALFQQFAVDAFVKVEQNRLFYHRTHQADLRSDNYRAVQDYLAGDTHGVPGRRIVLPSSFSGSPRAMVQDYQDAMAIMAKYGKADFFFTFTCNPKWREITEHLQPGQSASDRPDLITRVFKLKVDALFDDLLERHILGRVAAYISVFEWQKRGLPHVHMLLIMTEDTKPRTPDDIDKLIRAEIPDPVTEPELHRIVTTNMMHRPCGDLNPESPCMVDGSCSKRFPKTFRNSTNMEVDGYPEYRRRDSGRFVESGGHRLDNRHVVPYNEYFLLRYDAHINVEICAFIEAVKYLFKYVYKGHDRASIKIYRTGQTNGDGEVIDEIRAHLDARYVCAPEALHHLFGYKTEKKSDTVYRLAVHLPGFQTVFFHSDDPESALAAQAAKDTTLTAWFKLNQDCADIVESGNIPDSFLDSRQFHYIDMPIHYTFKKSTYSWNVRKSGIRHIGRMYAVSSQETERFILRILLLNTKGVTSFEDLRTVLDDNGVPVVYQTFVEAAKARGLLKDDSEYLQTLKEWAHCSVPAALRSEFAAILLFNEVNDPSALWDAVKRDLSEDYRHRGLGDDEADALAYFDIADRLHRLGKSFKDFVPEPAIRPPPINLNIVDPVLCSTEGGRLYSTLNPQQMQAADEILRALDDPSLPRLFHLDGPGGSGKTYLYSTLYNIFVGRGLKVACTAWTGIAANLLPSGRTAASLFKLDCRDRCRSSFHRRQLKDARELGQIDVFIWDESSMIHKAALNTVDAVLRDITQIDRPFGGKMVILGGDFRQILPVVEKGSRSDQVDACIKRSPLWTEFRSLHLISNMRVTSGDTEWIDFLLKVGDGSANDSESKVSVPISTMCDANIVEEVFGSVVDPSISDPCDKVILTPKNVDVVRLNAQVHDRMVGDEKIYLSRDEVVSDDPQDSLNVPTEFLYKLTPSSLPPHILKLKKGSVVMLLRNLDVSSGLCNGTRLIVKTLGNRTLGCHFACGDRKGQFTIIPRIDCYDDKLSFRHRRTQFPVCLSYALSINKAQGQSFSSIGLWIPTEVFSHGQLYVALSRVRSKEGLTIQSTSNRITNIVFEEVI